MRNLIFILALAVSQIAFAQQTAIIDLYVINASGNPEPGFSLTVSDFSNGGSTNISITTNANGRAIDSMLIGNIGMLYCDINVNGCLDTALMNYTTNNGPVVYFSDTLYTCNTSPNCNFAYGATPSAINPMLYSFSHQANSLNTFWNFGDGNSSTQASPTHTYSTPGKYVYCVTVDSCPTVCDSITIFGDPCNTNLNTKYQFTDSNLTYSFSASYIAQPTTSYDWTFGDGTTSSLQNPTHTYSLPGTYVYCLAIDSCAYTCDTIVVYPRKPVTVAGEMMDANGIGIPGYYYSFAIELDYPSLSLTNTFAWYHPSNPQQVTDVNGHYQRTVYPEISPLLTQLSAFVLSYDTCSNVPLNGPKHSLMINTTPETVLDSFNLGCNASPVGNCTASFIIDTVNSQPGNVVVWNTSTPAYTPNSAAQYLWDFGDGTTSSQPFPTYTYSGPGTYALCLTLTVPPTGSSASCISNYCDTLKVDSLGNIIQKSTGATIKLNVLDPATISIEENELSSFTLYPNPTSDFVNIKLDAISRGEVRVELISINGSKLKSISNEIDSGLNTLELDVSNMAAGIYFVKISKNGTSHFEKLSIR